MRRGRLVSSCLNHLGVAPVRALKPRSRTQTVPLCVLGVNPEAACIQCHWCALAGVVPCSAVNQGVGRVMLWVVHAPRPLAFTAATW